MYPHPKISRIIPKTIILSSPYNHQDFLCKHPKFPFNLYLNSILEDQSGHFKPTGKEQRDLLKIFRGLKNIKKIHQNDLALHRIRLPASKTKYLMKKAQRIEMIDIQDKLTPSKISPARLDFWLKYGKGLKSVNYQFVSQIISVKASIPLVEREVQRCLKFLPQHHKIATFKIWLPHNPPRTLQSLLEFQRYPASLKTFAIYQQQATHPNISNYDLVVSAFSRLKNLESFTLVGPNMLEVTLILEEKVPSILNLKKFNVQQGGMFNFGTMFDFNQCQAFQKLRHLKIGRIVESKDLSKLTNPPQLESLAITAGVKVQGIELISQFITLFTKSLKSLKMEVQNISDDQAEEKIKILFSKVSELEMLTSFKFKVSEGLSDILFGKKIVQFSPEILENLKGLFLKPIKLESFEWEVPRISSPAILLDLLKLLEGSCETIRKLKIVHPTVNLEKSQKVWLLNFLKRLERIEVLHLIGFSIKEQGFWMDLVDSFLRMSLLRFLEIGQVFSGFQEGWFGKLLGTILKKRGLKVLRIGPASGVGRGRIKGVLDLREIMKANPSLKEVSNNIKEVLIWENIRFLEL